MKTQIQDETSELPDKSHSSCRYLRIQYKIDKEDTHSIWNRGASETIWGSKNSEN